ncbi:MAG: hypothetical protein WBW04_17590 [Nitrolancea sp.]
MRRCRVFRVIVALVVALSSTIVPLESATAQDDSGSLFFLDPVAGTVLSGIQPLIVTGSAEVTNVSFFVDGGIWIGTVRGTSMWSLALDTTLLADGDHQVKATARRGDDTVVARAKVSITVGNTIKSIVDGDDWRLPPGVSVSQRSGIYGYGALNDILTIQTPVMTWADLQTGDGVYNWQLLDQLLDRGPAVVRLKCGTPSQIPEFIRHRHDWSTFTNDSGDVELPQWSPGWLDEWLPFITALGARYRDDPRFIGLQLGITASGEPFMDADAIAGFERMGLTPNVLRDFLMRYHGGALDAFRGSEWKVFSVIRPDFVRGYSGYFSQDLYAQAVRDATLPFLSRGLGLRGSGATEDYQAPSAWLEWSQFIDGMVVTHDASFPGLLTPGHLDGQVENWYGDNKNVRVTTNDLQKLAYALRLSLLRALTDQYSYLWLDADDLNLVGGDLARYVQYGLGKRPSESRDAMVVLGNFGGIRAWPRWLVPLNLNTTLDGQVVDTSGLGWGEETDRLGVTIVTDLKLAIDDRVLNPDARADVDVLITYLDTDGAWHLDYEGAEGVVATPSIVGGGSGTWKTVTLALSNAQFDSSVDGADFGIVTEHGPVTVQIVRVIRTRQYAVDTHVVQSLAGDY